MKLKAVIILLFNFVVNFSLYSQVNRLSLDESIKIAINNSKNLQIQDSRIKGSKAKEKEVNSQYFPQLKFNAGYSRLSEVNPFLVIIPFSTTPVQISQVLLNNYTFNLSLKQQLFTGFKISSQYKSAELNTQNEMIEYDFAENNLAYDVRIAYLNFYKAILLKKIADENYLRAEAHLNDTKNFLENGLATQSDLLRIEVQKSNIKLQQIESSNKIESARLIFNKLLGLPLDTDTEIDSVNEETIMPEININSVLDESFSNRYELKSIDKKILQANENIRSMKSTFYPSVWLYGNYYYSNPNIRIQPPRDQFDGTWDFGINLSWDLYNWGLTSSQVSQAEQRYSEVKTNYSVVKDQIELEVNQNYLETENQKSKTEVLKKTIELAEENYRVVSEKYKFQLATSTELIDAENDLMDAKIKYANAVIDLKAAILKLYKSAGRNMIHSAGL